MHRFFGEGAEVYDLGEPFAFAGLPLRDLGDGFEWVAADRTLRCWLPDGLLFEVYERDAWRQLVVAEVQPSAGYVAFTRSLANRQVRASGTARTTSLTVHADRWRLEQEVLVGKDTLGGSAAVVGGETRAVLDAVEDRSWDAPSVRGVLAVLPSLPAGAFVGMGELARDAFGVTVMFDNQGVQYAPR